MNLSDTPYTDLPAWFGWLRRLLQWHIELTRFTYGELADHRHRGLFIPDLEVDLLLADPPELPADLQRQRASLALERAELERAGADSVLGRFSRRFDLDALGQDVILLTLAAALDQRFQRIYAYIQDDVTRTRPTIDVALRLFCQHAAERLAGFTAFAADAPLRKHRLIQVFDDSKYTGSFLHGGLQLDPRIVTFLLGQNGMDQVITHCVRLSRPARRSEDLLLPTDMFRHAHHMLDTPTPGAVLVLRGDAGSGRRAFAEAICTARDRALLQIDCPRLRASQLHPVEAIERCMREALLCDAALLWQDADALIDSESSPDWQNALLNALDAYPGQSFLLVSRTWTGWRRLHTSSYSELEFPIPGFRERMQLWQRRLGDHHAISEADLMALTGAFRLTGGQIRDALQAARTAAARQDRALSLTDLYTACRGLSDESLGAIAWKVPITYSWDDLVLPADQIERLREVCIQVQHRHTVLEQWGFDRHLAMGKGLNLLFNGESGTGKTMAAEVLAGALGLDLYKIDLSGLVSKYIGDTEKNLDRVFSAAYKTSAILFFDEADAVFGKRSEVKDSHDRYANIEVAYLLQRIEAYDGVVILATNLRSNIDPAFIRRLHMVIDFPQPREPDRLRIWQKVFPQAAPLDPDVDQAFLARHFDLAGGNIRNAALFAAYLAADSNTPIGMMHILRALQREYQKIGRIFSLADLQQLYQNSLAEQHG